MEDFDLDTPEDEPELHLLARQGNVIAFKALLSGDPESANRLFCDLIAEENLAAVRTFLANGANPNGFFDPEEALISARAIVESAQYEAGEEEVNASLAQMGISMDEFINEMAADFVSGPAAHEIPLFRAARSGNVEALDLLLKAGAKLEIRDDLDESALYHTCSPDMMRRLVELGLSFEDKNQYGQTPLMAAVTDEIDVLPCVEALLAAGADINYADEEGDTAFMCAVGSARRPEVLRFLIAAGADPRAVSNHGYNAFHFAVDIEGAANAEESVRDTLTYLKELGVDIEQRNDLDQTPLARALRGGTGAEVRVLCELGADPNAVCTLRPAESEDEDEYDDDDFDEEDEDESEDEEAMEVQVPLLFHAVLNGVGAAGEAVEALLKAGADPLAVDEDGFTALQCAVFVLCQDGSNPEKLYDSFFTKLSKLNVAPASTRKDLEQYLKTTLPLLTPFVESFAERIPVDTMESAEVMEIVRENQVASIVYLAAYELWARR